MKREIFPIEIRLNMFLIFFLLFPSLLSSCGGGGGEKGGIVDSQPAVSPSAATGITTSGATLNGSVNPNGLSTTAWFEWGTDPTLTFFSNTPTQSVGSGTTSQSVSAALTGLSTGTTYYYRVAASNSSGTTKGSILSFVPGPAPIVPTLAATGIT